MSNAPIGMSSTWFQNPRSGPFWPGGEPLSDGLRSDSCRTGCQRAVACGGPISDAPGVASVERLRSFCRDGLRSVDVSRELARDRSLRANTLCARLPDGHPWSRDPHESGVRERASGLEADLFAMHANVIELSMALFHVGAVEADAGFREAQRATRFARRHSGFRQHLRRQSARSRVARRDPGGSGKLLCHRPRLSRFRAIAPVACAGGRASSPGSRPTPPPMSWPRVP